MARVLSAAALVISLAAATSAQEVVVPMSDVSVTVDLGSVDSNALDHWPQIGSDLTEAILSAATPYLASDGLLVSVVLNEMSLGGAPTLAEDGEFNRLSGWVYVRDDPAVPPILSQEIVLEADAYLPGGTSEYLIIPGRPEFYTALVNVFAYRVIEEVQELQ